MNNRVEQGLNFSRANVKFGSWQGRWGGDFRVISHEIKAPKVHYASAITGLHVEVILKLSGQYGSQEA